MPANSNRVSEDDRRIGQRVRAARIGMGISQEALGDKLGLTFQQVQKYEKGTNRISGGRLLLIASILHTKVSALVGETAGSTADDDILTAFSTKDGHALICAFNEIKSAENRALVLRIAQKLAGVS